MRLPSRLVLLAVPFFFVSSLPARAVDVEIGRRVVCDTRQQAEQFAKLYAGDPEAAASGVNAEEGNPTACIIATTAYVVGPKLGDARNNGPTFEIVPILVIGLVTPEGLQVVVAEQYFSAFEVEEREA